MNQNIFKDFVKYVSFNIIGQIAYSCYTLADTFFVSVKTGTNGMTALNLAFPIFCIISGIGLMLGIGGGSRYSILKTRQEQNVANEVFTNAFVLASGLGTLFSLTGLFFSRSLSGLLGANTEVLAITNLYLKTLMLFAPAFMLNHLLQCFVRNDGNPSLSMRAMMTGSIANIVLDYIFIFPFDMGIFGAAFATGLSPIISMLVLSPYWIKKRNGFHFAKPISLSSCLNRTHISRIIANGVPPFLTEAASGIVMFLFNFIILRLAGNTGVAAFGVLSVISLVVIALYTGLSQGIQPIISQNYGAKHEKNVRLLLRYALVTSVLLSAMIYTFIYQNAPSLVAVFNREQNPVLTQYAITGLKLYFTACPFIGLNIVISTYFISISKPLPAQLISFSRSFFILIPAAFLLSHLFQMTGVWCAYPVAESIVSLLALCLMILNLRQSVYKKSIPN